MIARIVLWRLADADATIGELREYLRDESVEAFSDVPGLIFQAWVSDEPGERWGAVYLFESREAADQPLPSRAQELIGKPPDLFEEFDVEATVGPGWGGRSSRAPEILPRAVRTSFS